MPPEDDVSETGLRISVVVPHLNQPEALRRCLASLQGGARQADEITVVDNGSRVPPEDVCAEFPGVRLLVQPVPGPGPARNLGAAASGGEVLAFVDADCLADRGWLAAVAAEMRDPAARILGGDVSIAYVDPARLTMIEAYESIFGYQVERYIRDMNFTVTSNLAMRPDVLAAVGPFAGLSIAEDRDWGQRATAMGYTIRYVPGMKVYHPARRTFADLRKKWDRHTAHDYTEARLKPGGRRAFLIKTLAMGLSPLAELPRILLSPRVSGPRNRGLALLGLIRTRAYRARIMLWLCCGGDPAKLAGAWNRS